MTYSYLSYTAIIIICILKCSIDLKSQSAKELDEVIVMGDRIWIENGVINAIPSKNEKKLSNSPASLIGAMDLTFLRDENGNIVNEQGESVTVFINGERSDRIDISTFWPKEVKKIQYLINPSDPCYEGVKYAINFIMDKYEWGGVTKAQVYQQIPNEGAYDASSKFSYRNVTLGALFYSNYKRDHRTTTENYTEYTDLFYNKSKFDKIIRKETSNIYTRKDNIDFTINAKCRIGNTRLTHSFAIGWNHNPASGDDGLNEWSDNLFGSSSSQYVSKYNSITPQFNGDYFFKISNKWYLPVSWNYSYASSTAHSWNTLGETNSVFNEISEKVNSAKISFSPMYIPADNLTIQLQATGSSDWFSTQYSGSTQSIQKQNRQEFTSTLSAYLTLTSKLSLTLCPGFTANRLKIGSLKDYVFTPLMYLGVFCNPTRKFSQNISIQYTAQVPTASQTNPVLIKESELLWSKGNPNLSKLTKWDFYSFSNYLISNNYSAGIGLDYELTTNDIISSYTPAPISQGGLIKDIINSKDSHIFKSFLSLSGRFLRKKLSITARPHFYYYHNQGFYRNYKTTFISATANFRVNNCRFSIEYNSPSSSISQSGMMKVSEGHRMNISMIYGTGRLFLKIHLKDLFKNKRKIHNQYHSHFYSNDQLRWSTGRMLAFTLSYTFSYGKKIEEDFDISRPGVTKTSVNY